MDDITLARAVHIVAVIHWIGGVAFVTPVVLPVISVMTEPARRLALLENIEGCFSTQVLDCSRLAWRQLPPLCLVSTGS